MILVSPAGPATDVCTWKVPYGVELGFIRVSYRHTLKGFNPYASVLMAEGVRRL